MFGLFNTAWMTREMLLCQKSGKPPPLTGRSSTSTTAATHGRKFKLSDYRGKVVLLDFWGHW
jgi:hypothetical protein